MKDSWDKVSQSLQGRNQSFTWLVLFTLLSFGSGFKVQGSGFRVQGSRFRVQGSRFKVQGSGGGFAAKKEANPASLRSAAPSKGRGSCGCSLLPLEGGAPKGRRLEGESGIPDTLFSPLGEGAP